MSMRLARALLLVLFLLPAMATRAASRVDAHLSRQTIQMGDTVTLTVSLEGQSQASQPDWSPLQSDFRIRNVQRNSQLQIVNGRGSERVQWSVALQPRHAGRLTIPPLHVAGTRTRALALRVEPPSANAQGGPGDPVFLQVTPSTSSPYVGQQVDLEVKLFYALDLANGSLDQPHGDGLDVRQVGHDQNYQSRRNGVTYNVLERHYALIPQQAGTIHVAGLGFRGEALDNNGFGGFFTQGRPVHARSAAFALHVRQPPAHGSGPWVPARNLSLDLQGLPDDGKVQVGEPLTLTLTELAAGVPFETLPEPTLPRLQGVQIYPDQPQDQTRVRDRWLVGRRSRTFAVVPTHAGTLRIPAITLGWWDVVKDQQETARIPAHTVTVVAAAGMPAASSTSAVPPAAGVSAGVPPAGRTAARPRAHPSAAAAAAHGAGPWRGLALASLGLCIVLVAVLAAVLWRRRRTAVAPEPPGPAATISSRRARHRFLAAARRGDVQASAQTLLHWAQAERPHLRHLGAVAEALAPAQQRRAVAMLQRHRFAAGASEPFDGGVLVAAFRHGFDWKTALAEEPSALPPLYPPARKRRG